MTKDSAFLYWLATSKVTFKKAQLLSEVCGGLEQIFYHPEELKKANGLFNLRTIEMLKSRADERLINNELKTIFSKNVHIVTIKDKDYPKELIRTSDPPLILYAKGRISALQNKRIAVVGTRACTRAGFENTFKITEELSRNGVSVISGMARGIDTAALNGALSGGTPCAAVLGCGIDIVYPNENHALYESIAKNGVVLSEYPPGTPPHSYNFPRRNRIISGMCPGVLIAQAPVKSGSAITMRYAVEENRDVFAVPGNINEETSELPNLLITEGAIPVTDASSILDFYGWQHEKTVNFQKNTLPELDFYEQALYTLLKQGEWNIDELARTAGMEISQASLALTGLEIKGLAERLPGNAFGLRI